jgi:hypothetical protein
LLGNHASIFSLAAGGGDGWPTVCDQLAQGRK